MNELLKRSLTGILFVILVIGAVYIHPFASGALFLAITILSLIEFYQLTTIRSVKPFKVTGVLSGAGLFLLCFIFSYSKGSITLIPFLIILLLVIPAMGLFRKGNYPANLAITFMGLLYVALPMSLLNILLLPPHLGFVHTPHLAAGYFFILWSFDTGAYVTGKPLGKHKMVPGISPAKSWEGFTGGVIIAATICCLVSNYYTELTRFDWYVMLLIIIILGTIGDLFESVLKRIAGVKDSGTLLPGHGGVLDRFDSVFLSMPVFVIYYLIKYNLLSN